jgi:hypothetical protein
VPYTYKGGPVNVPPFVSVQVILKASTEPNDPQLALELGQEGAVGDPATGTLGYGEAVASTVR